MRILIVEDETTLRESLVAQFTASGFNVEGAADGEEGLYQGLEFPFDVAVIDLGLPKLTGMELIKKLRAKDKKFPILILTARDQWQEKVAALQAGADDYVTKPFHYQEVLARVQALLRRSSGKTQSVWKAGPIALDSVAQQVTVNDKAVELTSFEYKILELLMHRNGEVISKTELTEQLYAQDFDRDSNTIEVLVGRLRRKLDPDDTYHPIETLRGRGYRFALTIASA
ncbi:MAG TPA: response regulator transcription factor [Steroidobacteraceae bacterium]|nr:response regulator transcription factor [Steroidobacteraceae bacterium]